jgi:hypothetical protein
MSRPIRTLAALKIGDGARGTQTEKVNTRNINDNANTLKCTED